MRLETKAERQRKEKRNRIILSLIIAALMILSVVGFALEFARREERAESGFYEHKVRLGNEEIIVRTLYKKAETPELGFKPYIGFFLGKKLYYYSEPELAERASRLLAYLSYFSILNEACLASDLGNYTCYNEELPVKDCSSLLIIFEKGIENKTEVRKTDNCIFIRGNVTEIDKAIDRFLYELFEIE